MEAFLPFFLVFAALWGAQLYGTARQGQHFMREVSRLRSLGETAIGASSLQRTRRRVYVALAADETDRVTGAIELSGFTIFARAKPVEELVGEPLAELAHDDVDERRAKAARMAARALLDLEVEAGTDRNRRRRWGQRTSGPTTGPKGHRAVPRVAASRSSAGHLPSRRA